MKTHAPKQKTMPAHPVQSSVAKPATVGRALAEPGRPLESSLRREMEQRFDHDFSRVRIHSGDVAEQSTRDVNARAYTAGQDIVFGDGELAEGTVEGRELIAHELTHVVQHSGIQLAPRTTPPPAKPTPPSWLGSLAAGATHVQGDIWDVNIKTLGGASWVGPYDQLKAHIGKQGFVGRMEAAHIVGGEHLGDIGSPYSYDKAPCVAVDKTVHARWTIETSAHQSKQGMMGGRGHRPAVGRIDVVDLYDELYRAHPELREMARNIVGAPGKGAPRRAPKPPASKLPKGSVFETAKPFFTAEAAGPAPLPKGSIFEMTPAAPAPPAQAAPARVVQKFGSAAEVDYDPSPSKPRAAIKAPINLADYPPDREGPISRAFKRGPALQNVTSGGSLALFLASTAAETADEETQEQIKKFIEPVQSHFLGALRDAQRDFQENFPSPEGLLRAAGIEGFAKAYEDAAAKLRLPRNARTFAAIMIVFTPEDQRDEALRTFGPALANRGANPTVRASFRDAALAYEEAMADLQAQLFQYPVRLKGVAHDIANRAAVLQRAGNELAGVFWSIMQSPAIVFPPIYYEAWGIYRVSMVFQQLGDSVGAFAEEIRSRERAYEAMIARLDALLIQVGDRRSQISD